MKAGFFMRKNIDFERELDFVKRCLDYHKIAHQTYTVNNPAVHLEDLGIRHALGFQLHNLEGIKNLFLKSIHARTLSFITDELCCHYIVLPLPTNNYEQVFIIGPYITAEEKDSVTAFMQQPVLPAPWINILKNYYFQICTMANEETLYALAYTLANSIWGNDNYRTQYLGNGLIETLSTITPSSDPQQALDLFSNIELIETLYTSENELANAISHGQSSQARAIFSNLPLSSFKYELEPLRNLKNFSIITNTLFRKAAEQGGVHPIYVDQLSTSFMHRIEDLARGDNVFELWTEMIHRYCALVNTHNTRHYSLPIQRVITRINLDLSADLSLKTTAAFLKVNASYLSSLFKKETGYTLTNYVNKKRMEQAAFLLSTTTQSISSIGQQCGVLDENYLTKLFKRHYQMTPSQYRDTIVQNSYSNKKESVI